MNNLFPNKISSISLSYLISFIVCFLMLIITENKIFMYIYFCLEIAFSIYLSLIVGPLITKLIKKVKGI